VKGLYSRRGYLERIREFGKYNRLGGKIQERN